VFSTRVPVVAGACLLLSAACVPVRDEAPSVSDASHDASAIVDDFGDTLRRAAPPARIASLNPAATELLFALGAGNRLVGRTTWDTWPPEAAAVPDLGPGIRPNVEAILAARPDLVVLYATGDNRAAARTLRTAGVPTLALRLDRIADFARVASVLGRVIGDTAAVRVVVDSVGATLAAVERAVAGRPRPAVAWRVWDDPLIVVGAGSYLHELLERAGGRNVYADLAAPSPTVAFEDLARRDPDVLLVGPSGASRIAADPAWRALRAVREGRVLVVDTATTGRPALRMGEAAASLAALLHPGVAVERPPVAR
jgi:ABC-type Fe3+-hydroxamate transport system substrate-binding protein